MASDPLSPVPASDRDVRHRSRLFVHPAASVADRDDAKWLGALAEYDGDERRHRDSDRRDNPAGRRRTFPTGASADHDSGCIDRRLAVLCPAPARAHVLVPR